MGWESMFTRYGQPSREAEISVRDWLRHPQDMDTPQAVKQADGHAINTINRMQYYINMLQEYRLALAARYAELETMTYKHELRLKRDRNYDGKVHYTIRLVKILEDGHEVVEGREVFPGTERHKAFARFEEMKKQRPGITAVKDIERRAWER